MNFRRGCCNKQLYIVSLRPTVCC